MFASFANHRVVVAKIAATGMNVTAVEAKIITAINALQRKIRTLLLDFATGAWDAKMTPEELNLMAANHPITFAKCRNGGQYSL